MENEQNSSNNISVLESSSNQVSISDKQTILKDSFNGYQVVRGEFFSHIFEPSITFSNSRVYLNTACLKRLPEVDYVQILINPKNKKLAVRPSNPNEKDSFLWCSARSAKRRPKKIICRIFFAKVFQLMEWNPNYRYKILGKLITSGEEHLFIFDLTATQIFQRVINGGKSRSSRTPVFPIEWQNQFGVPLEEHRKFLQVNVFKDYTVFGVKSNRLQGTPNKTCIDKNGKEI
jgi:hypothetical protein